MDAPLPQELRIPTIRQSPPAHQVGQNLGLLADLAGSWQGHGFNLIARPDKEGGADLFLELNQTEETLKFDPIATSIPNRGFAQNDVELFGLTYLQRISDIVTGGALHIEPGIWITERTPDDETESTPPGAQMIARMGSIPHGNAILADGIATSFTGPPVLKTPTAAYNGSSFPSFNSSPIAAGGPVAAAGSSEADVPPPAPPGGFPAYTLTNPATALNPRTPFGNIPAKPLPADINGVPMQDVVNDPIKVLQAEIAQQVDAGFRFEGVALNIATQKTVAFSTTPNAVTPSVNISVSDADGGIANLPFLVTNAKSALVYATFWITKVSHPQRRESFLQLQYAQMVMLNFPILNAPTPKPLVGWPHISVATLRKTFG